MDKVAANKKSEYLTADTVMTLISNSGSSRVRKIKTSSSKAKKPRQHPFLHPLAVLQQQLFEYEKQ